MKLFLLTRRDDNGEIHVASSELFNESTDGDINGVINDVNKKKCRMNSHNKDAAVICVDLGDLDIGDLYDQPVDLNAPESGQDNVTVSVMINRHNDQLNPDQYRYMELRTADGRVDDINKEYNIWVPMYGLDNIRIINLSIPHDSLERAYDIPKVEATVL